MENIAPTTNIANKTEMKHGKITAEWLEDWGRFVWPILNNEDLSETSHWGPTGRDMIRSARHYLGYSPKTSNKQIWTVIRSAWFKLGFDKKPREHWDAQDHTKDPRFHVIPQSG